MDVSLLSVRSVAAALSLSHWTIRKYIATGIIPCVRIGGRVLVEPRVIEQLIEQNRSKGSEHVNSN